MSLKKTFKYILFAFVFMFLFVPSVKASTKYMICDYEASNAKHNVRLYYENSSNKYILYYIAAYSKIESKWNKYNSDLKIDNYGYITLKNTNNNKSAIKIFDSSKDSLNKNIMSISSNKCPKINIRSNAKDDKNLIGKKENFELDDLSCKYESNKSYYLSSNFVGVEELSKSNPKFDNKYSFKRFVIPSGTAVDDYGYPRNLDSQHNYSDQYYMYNYLKYASKYGCPRSIAYGGFTAYLFGGYESQLNNVFYPTYKWGADVNDLRQIDPSGENDAYSIVNLVCNTDTFNSFKKEVDSHFTFWISDYNYYAKLDNDGWKKVRNNLTTCKYTKNMSEYKHCFLKNKRDTIQKYYEDNIRGKTTLKLKKVGCDKELKDIDFKFSEIKNEYDNLIKKMRDSGELTEEQAADLLEEWEQAEESIDGIIDSLFAVDDSELQKLTGNKNKQVDCNAIFGDPCDKNSLSLMCFITVIFNIIRYLIPGILVLLGSIDFAKVVMSNEKEAMSKALSTFIQRIIVAIAIFFLPLLINFILKIFDSGYTMSDKINCVIESLSGDSSD